MRGKGGYARKRWVKIFQTKIEEQLVQTINST